MAFYQSFNDVRSSFLTRQIGDRPSDNENEVFRPENSRFVSTQSVGSGNFETLPFEIVDVEDAIGVPRSV
jgi:hypothetical protein